VGRFHIYQSSCPGKNLPKGLCVMQMDILRRKSADMVCKEIAANLLGYNLIRAMMGEAAKPERLSLRWLSFAAARRAAIAPVAFWLA
jgi:hypothetical protein